MRNFALAACFTLCGCSSLLSFDVTSSGTATIQGAPGGGLLGNALGRFGGFDKFNLSLKPAPPAAGSDLSFLQQIDFFISAPGLAQIHIAGAKNLAVGQSTVELTLDKVDIAPYAKSDTFSITTVALGHAPGSDTMIEADITLNIHASLL